MKLGKLGKILGARRLPKDVAIADIAYHSQACRPGSCFVAVSGFRTDGHRYVAEAVKRGAKTVVVEKEVPVPRGVTKIVVPNSRDALARLSADFFGHPSLELCLVGVTGTNGKTTVIHLLNHIAGRAGFSSRAISTVNNPSGRTTPESYDLQKAFRQMVEEQVRYAFLEVTSHALDLQRVTGLHFNGAIFTNLSQDHLDFHGSMENYFAAKARLFRERLPVSEKKKLWAVLNADDPYGQTLAGGLPAKVLRFSLEKGGEIRAEKIECSWEGLSMNVQTSEGRLKIFSPLKGRFNASNLLAAIAAALALEFPLEAVAEGIAGFQGVPGRLQEVPNPRGIKIFVDYAHTPDALTHVLETLRELGAKRIVTVFGCGGDRDKTKRPWMGKAVSQKSEVTIVTSDNPRSENPQAIIQDVLRGVEGDNEVHTVIDRQEAIAKALGLARPGDCLLIAGKGHETFQEIAGEQRPFDDAAVVRKLL